MPLAHPRLVFRMHILELREHSVNAKVRLQIHELS